ncbi:MAG: ATP-binding protein [Atopobiaceae bacterium]|nr:ATP-binding protein [Atopobiaceae bacterium]
MDLCVEAIIANVDMVTDFVNEQVKRMGGSRRAIAQIDVALDEIFSNICNYAYGNDVGDVTVRVCDVADQNSICITLEDKGIPFDPLSREDPDTSLGLHERGIGGLGIYMAKQIMDDVRYEHRDGFNMLTVVKSL